VASVCVFNHPAGARAGRTVIVVIGLPTLSSCDHVCVCGLVCKCAPFTKLRRINRKRAKENQEKRSPATSSI